MLILRIFLNKFVAFVQNFQREAVMKRELIEQLLEIRRKESSVDPNLQKVAAEWETMIKLETDRWNTLQHALRLVRYPSYGT